MRAPVKRPKLVVIELRVIEARKIVARQQALVDKLRTDGQPTAEAEASLEMYVNALAHLEALRAKLRQEAQPKRARDCTKGRPDWRPLSKIGLMGRLAAKSYYLAMISQIKAFLRDEGAATAIEYSLIAGAIALAIIAVTKGIGTKLNTTFSSVSTQLK